MPLGSINLKVENNSMHSRNIHMTFLWPTVFRRIGHKSQMSFLKLSIRCISLEATFSFKTPKYVYDCKRALLFLILCLYLFVRKVNSLTMISLNSLIPLILLILKLTLFISWIFA